MLLGCREQILSVKNKGFLAGDRLKKRIFYSPSRKFRREVCFGTYCKFLNYPLPAISFESNFYSIIKFISSSYEIQIYDQKVCSSIQILFNKDHKEWRGDPISDVISFNVFIDHLLHHLFLFCSRDL